MGEGLGLFLPSPSQPASPRESIWVGEILGKGEVCQALGEHRWRSQLKLHFLSEEPPSGFPWQERQGSRAGGLGLRRALESRSPQWSLGLVSAPQAPLGE